MAREPDASETRRRWDAFAQEDPEFYIVGHGEHGRETFLASGREIVDRVIARVGEQHFHGRMLEIGCGIGRTAQAFAPRFDRVDAVDISPTMIERAGTLDPPANVHYAVTSGADLKSFDDAVFDFVFSFVVFQHVRSAVVIQSMLREIGRVTKDRGTAVLQFDTRPMDLKTRVAFSLPDFMLPRTRRRGIRRIRRDADWVRSTLAEAGFDIALETDRYLKPLEGERTHAFHHFVARRRERIQEPLPESTTARA